MKDDKKMIKVEVKSRGRFRRKNKRFICSRCGYPSAWTTSSYNLEHEATVHDTWCMYADALKRSIVRG